MAIMGEGGNATLRVGVGAALRRAHLNFCRIMHSIVGGFGHASLATFLDLSVLRFQDMML